MHGRPLRPLRSRQEDGQRPHPTTRGNQRGLSAYCSRGATCIMTAQIACGIFCITCIFTSRCRPASLSACSGCDCRGRAARDRATGGARQFTPGSRSASGRGVARGRGGGGGCRVLNTFVAVALPEEKRAAQQQNAESYAKGSPRYQRHPRYQRLKHSLSVHQTMIHMTIV